MKVTHRHLEVFHAVVRSGSVTAAALVLHTSQPTVSRELARLEQQLGFALFDRASGRLRPTARGLALYDEVERSQVGLTRILARAESLQRLSEGRLAVACLPALAHALLPGACGRFARDHPEVGIRITPLESPQLEDALATQQHDLGLVEHDRAPPGTRLHPLFAGEEVCVLPAGHPLLERTVLTPADFADQRFLSLAADDPYRGQVDAVFREHGVPRRLVIETASAVSLCSLVQAGLGVAIINPLTALACAGQGLEVRRFSVSIAFQVALVLPEQRPSTPLTARFRTALEAEVRACMQAVGH